jgi:hypothetical protein
LWFVLEHVLENVAGLLHIVKIAMRMEVDNAVYELCFEVLVAGEYLLTAGVAYLHKVFTNHFTSP